MAPFGRSFTTWRLLRGLVGHISIISGSRSIPNIGVGHAISIFLDRHRYRAPGRVVDIGHMPSLSYRPIYFTVGRILVAAFMLGEVVRALLYDSLGSAPLAAASQTVIGVAVAVVAIVFAIIATILTTNPPAPPLTTMVWCAASGLISIIAGMASLFFFLLEQVGMELSEHAVNTIVAASNLASMYLLMICLLSLFEIVLGLICEAYRRQQLSVAAGDNPSVIATDIERPAGLLYNTGMGQIVIALDSRYSNSPLARQLVEAGFSVQVRSNRPSH